jgi:alpha-beta hydrolase superfamily lysophospholipase
VKTIRTITVTNDLALEVFEYPVDHPKALLLIVHGSVDHKAHYEEFAEYAQSQGIFAVLPDLRGHGNSFAKEIGLISDKRDGWELYKKDLSTLKQVYQYKVPNVPLFVLGHSMGAMILQDWIRSESVDGAIISGTGYTSPIMMRLGLFMIHQEAKKHGYEARSPKLHELIYGTLDKRAKKMGIDSFITRDVAQRKRYKSDPKCQFKITVDYANELAKGILRVGKSSTYKINPSLPLLFISGEKDPVGGHNANYVKRAVRQYEKNGNPVTAYIYPEAFHNMLQELNKTEVFEDVVEWMSALT